MKKFWKEFKEFALKGSMIDLAVGMIIGTAFSGVVTALTENIIKPLIGAIFGGVNLDEVLKIPVGKVLEDGTQATINIGSFIGALINFLIMAFVIFLIVRGINKMRKRAEELRKKE